MDLKEVATIAVWAASAPICKPEGLSLLPEPDGIGAQRKTKGLKRERMREIIYESAKLSYLYYFIILLLIAV